MNIVEKTIKHLLDTNPFYAHFFLASKIVYDKYNIPTAAAAFTSTGPVLVFNTEFISKLTHEELGGVVEHEVLHLLFDHPDYFNKYEGVSKRTANIAMDLSINQFIKTLPSGCVNLDLVNELTGLDLPPAQTWEYYYDALKQYSDKLQKTSTVDDHESNLPDQIKPGEAREVKRMALDSAMKNSKGNIPDAILKVFDDLQTESKPPWQQLLSNFVAKATSNISKNTRKRVNRRFGIDQPGKVKKRELTLGVCVDSSGSISDESYIAFMGEIDRISKICLKTYLIEADCIVQGVETINKNRRFEKKRRGCGGTAYQPAISKALELKCDAIVYFGDFDCADTPENPGVPFLWVGVGSEEPPGKFGSVIRL